MDEETESDEDSEDETDVTVYDKEVRGWPFLIYWMEKFSELLNWTFPGL